MGEGLQRTKGAPGHQEHAQGAAGRSSEGACGESSWLCLSQTVTGVHSLPQGEGTWCHLSLPTVGIPPSGTARCRPRAHKAGLAVRILESDLGAMMWDSFLAFVVTPFAQTGMALITTLRSENPDQSCKE